MEQKCLCGLWFSYFSWSSQLSWVIAANKPHEIALPTVGNGSLLPVIITPALGAIVENSDIEWTDHTFNAWWGCHKVSDACKFCYAETMANRFHPNLWGLNGQRLLTSNEYWKKLAQWDKKAAKVGVKHRVFPNSMSDIYENRADLVAPRERLFDEVEIRRNLIFMFLTKRAENIMALTSRWKHGFPDNVWVGVTAESQWQLDRRAPLLLDVPCNIKFLSCEPLLGNLQMGTYLLSDYDRAAYGGQMTGNESRSKINWVIVGGESGTTARPMWPEWVDNIFDQCQQSNTPFFFKQWGSSVADANGKMVNRHKKLNGRLFRGQEWNELPEVRCYG